MQECVARSYAFAIHLSVALSYVSLMSKGDLEMQTTTPNRRSILLMAWVYARMAAARSGNSPRQHIAEAMRQAWAEEKAEAARKAARCTQLAARAALNVCLADPELNHLATRTVPYSFARGVRTGRI